MDMVYVSLGAALWGLMALLVKGLRALQGQAGSRS